MLQPSSLMHPHLIGDGRHSLVICLDKVHVINTTHAFLDISQQQLRLVLQPAWCHLISWQINNLGWVTVRRLESRQGLQAMERAGFRFNKGSNYGMGVYMPMLTRSCKAGWPATAGRALLHPSHPAPTLAQHSTSHLPGITSALAAAANALEGIAWSQLRRAAALFGHKLPQSAAHCVVQQPAANGRAAHRLCQHVAVMHSGNWWSDYGDVRTRVGRVSLRAVGKGKEDMFTHSWQGWG